MKKILISLLLALIALHASGQIEKQLIGKTFERQFSAAGFIHRASYTFFKDKIKYHVWGLFVDDTYYIIGSYKGNKFVGHDPQTGKNYVIYIKILSPTKILINKQGVDPRYKKILLDKPVKGWHEFYLKHTP